MEAQDWANLNKFKQDNIDLLEDKNRKIEVVFFGNSITQDWHYQSPNFFPGKPYVNRGIGGQTTPQLLLRFRQDVIQLKPKVVVILAGTNDVAGNTGPSTEKMIVDNIKSMSELAKTHDIKVILCSIIPVYDYPWKPGLNPAQKIVNINEKLKEYAVKNNHLYLDYFASMVDDKNGLLDKLTYDGVHPNLEGYLVMERLVEEAIAKMLE